MKRIWISLFITTLITLGSGCNDTDPTATSQDAGIDDGGVDARDGGDGGQDTDDDYDPLIDWPGQNVTGNPLDLPWDMPEVDEGIRFLIANVGNIDAPRCGNVDFNLCWTEQEEIIAAEIARRSPDVILLQEVLTPTQCQSVADPAPDHACHPDHRPDEPEQARRLVGPDYTILCDSRFGYECVAAHVDAASIPGCDDGQFCRGLARTGDVVDDCDPGFTISAVTLVIDGQELDVVNVHPPSNGFNPEQARECRRAYFENVLGENAPLIEADLVLIGGDFNFDPFRQSNANPDVELWNQYVFHSFDETSGDALQFAYHSGLPEHDPPYWTSPLMRQTLDHVVSNGLRGRCITLGAQPGEAALDRLHGQLHEHLDHLAIQCDLAL